MSRRKRKSEPAAKVIDIRTGREKAPDPRTLEEKMDRLVEQVDELKRLARRYKDGQR